jgi:hypothetical protein
MIQAAPPSPPPACSSAEHRQFDFWVGRWNVFDAKTGKPAGSSVIEKLYGGCVLRENWSEPGFAGGSLNILAADGKWHQTWTDQNGALREFVGGLVDGKMVLTADMRPPLAPKARLVRMTFTPNADGTVRQFSDYSDDGGKTWNFRYDYLYQPLKPTVFRH